MTTISTLISADDLQLLHDEIERDRAWKRDWSRDYRARRGNEYKEKENLAAREYNQRNREEVTRKSKERRRTRKIDAIARLGGRCTDCSGIFHPSVYDFHHADPAQKNPDLDTVKFLLLSKKKFEEELAKCVLLCANCHRLRHNAGEEWNV